MKKLKSKSKPILFLILNIISFSQTAPFIKNVLAGSFLEDNFPVIVGDVKLTIDKPYYKNGEAVEFCELGKDGCGLYYINEDQPHKYLYMNNYNGPEISIYTTSPRVLWVEISGDNIINTTKEYGIKHDEGEASLISTLEFTNESDSRASLTINVDSETERANGIIKKSGELHIGKRIDTTININSKAPQEKKTKDEVTGITIEENGILSIFDTSNTIINNPTGNFAIYASRFYNFGDLGTCDDYNVDYVDSRITCHNYLEARYKITDGYGDFMPGNTFETKFLLTPGDIFLYNSPTYTADQTKTETTGYFRILKSIQGENAYFDDTIKINEKFSTVENRMKQSLRRSYDYFDDKCVLYGCNNKSFDVDPENSYLVNLTNPDNKEIISSDDEYGMVIAFKTLDRDHGFPKNSQGPNGYAVVNDIVLYEKFDLVDLSIDRSKISYLYKLTPTEEEYTPEENEEPKPEETEPKETEEPETPIGKINPDDNLPEQIKTESNMSFSPVPNKNIENPNTSAQNPKILISIIIISSMIHFSCRCFKRTKQKA